MTKKMLSVPLSSFCLENAIECRHDARVPLCPHSSSESPGRSRKQRLHVVLSVKTIASKVYYIMIIQARQWQAITAAQER